MRWEIGIHWAISPSAAKVAPICPILERYKSEHEKAMKRLAIGRAPIRDGITLSGCVMSSSPEVLASSEAIYAMRSSKMAPKCSP